MNRFWQLTFSFTPQEINYKTLSKENSLIYYFLWNINIPQIQLPSWNTSWFYFLPLIQTIFTEHGISDKNKNSYVLQKTLFHSFEGKGGKGFLSLFPSSLSKDIHTKIISRPSLASYSLLPCTGKLCGGFIINWNLKREKIKEFKMSVLETIPAVQILIIHTGHYLLKNSHGNQW